MESKWGADAAQESSSRSDGCDLRYYGARERRRTVEPAGDALTPEPVVEGGNGEAADHSD